MDIGANSIDDTNSIKNKLSASIEQIKSYNDTHDTKITNHIIIFPYHAGPLHWNLGKIELVFAEASSIIEAYIDIYEPFGGQASGYNDLIKDINSLDEFQLIKIIRKESITKQIKQQYDGTSCGTITAENGKEFLKDGDDRTNLLEVDYKTETRVKELRLRHINEINEEAFFVAQRDNIAYEATGDKPIDNRYEIIKALRELIQKPENDWIKQVIFSIQQSKEDITIRESLDLFKQFLIQIDLSSNTDLEISSNVLKTNSEFREGAIDLIGILALNITHSSKKFSGNNFPNKEQSSMTESKTKIDKRKLNTTGPKELAIKEKDAKLQLIKEKNEEFSLDDFKMECEYTYKYKLPEISVIRKLFAENPSFELGKSDNFLFFHMNVELLQRFNFDLSEIVDSRGNSILHYAIFRHDLDLINAILLRAKLDGTIGKLVNHRNIDGTSSLGMAFLFEDKDNLAGIEIASIFADTYEYQINNYLNNKTYMDYSSVELIGGTNLLHNVILAASKCTSKAAKQCISKFFKILSKRMLSEQIDDEAYCNPNYPTMNPGLLTTGLDGHMISTSHLLEKLKFSSKRVEKVCKEYFRSVLQIYEADQFDDSSGDSEDEFSHAYIYKEMLLEFDKFTKDSLDGHLTAETVNDNFQRTFDKYSASCGIAPSTVWELISTEDKFDQTKWDTFWQTINSNTKEIPSLSHKNAIDSIVVPLFHGVPFMHSQYTNCQRREVVKKLFEINQKLLGKFSGSMTEEEYTLTKEEKILIGIHSRTSTATVGMQSLYEMMVASEEDLERLDEADNKLLKYFTRKDFPTGFKDAMKDYIFNFSSSPIRNFWENNYLCEGIPRLAIMPDDTIVKYRFPVIATSKAPDHPIRFAIGRNVEGTTRGETPMQPEYIDGHPTHRLAGLVYITLHNLSDLISEHDSHTMIDVNQGLLASGNISEGRGATRFKNQLECDFLGKMDSDRIVAVIPIIYPSMKEGESFEPIYHQSLYGLSPDSRKNSVVSPTKIKKDTDTSPNPDIMSSSGNIAGFGKMIIPSVVSMINGIVVSIAKLKNKFLCTIKENNELIPYEVGFDQDSGQFSKAQNSLTFGDSTLIIDRLWREIVKQLQQPEMEDLIPQISTLSINHESDVIGNSEEIEGLISKTGTLSINDL